MFGTLRLILALMVIASHVEVSHEVDLGASAVIIFFLLSGFVMTATVRRYYAKPKFYGKFLLDRAGRIFPQYLFWVLMCILWTYFFDHDWRPIGWNVIAENILMVPAMYGVFDLKPWLTGVRYVSQAWSLSLEWHFYMLIPWLLLIKRARMVAGIISLFVFTLSTLNIISPYIYSYHLLLGVFFIFLFGSVLYDELQKGVSDKSQLFLPYVYLLLLGIVANSTKTLHPIYTAEVYLGIICGVPLVMWLARLPAHPVDDWLGNFSYGIFLCHNLVLAVIYHFNFLHDRWVIFATASGISMVLSGITYYCVERPLIAWRHKLRGKTSRASKCDHIL